MSNDCMPLQSKTVLVPRGKGHAKPFSDLVKKNGGIPLEIPLIAFRPVQLTKKIAEILTNLYTYDWIIFTSNVTVETFFSLVSEEVKPNFPKVAVIGTRTKQVLLEKGVNVHFTPTEYVAEGFVNDFLPLISPGLRVLIPKGNLARDLIATSLIENGAIVDEVIMYETYAPVESKNRLVDLLNNQVLDILTFTSPSTVDHFMEIVHENFLFDKLQHCMVACIGPVTSEKALEAGLPVHVSPAKHTVQDMIQGIIENMNQVT
jgi:uroporphyrinogen-III synthase